MEASWLWGVIRSKLRSLGAGDEGIIGELGTIAKIIIFAVP